MFVTRAEEDTINNLPEHLIDLILERVPFQDCVRTSILSRKWRYRWTTIKSLVLDEHFSKQLAKKGAYSRNGFLRIITHILIFHEGRISKFVLHIPKMHLDSFQEIDQWMLMLSRKGVKEITVTNSNQRYEIPLHLFSCLELRKLKLENCFYKPPLEFKGYLNLGELGFKNIYFKANICGTQISYPQLNILTFIKCTNLCKFNIKAAKLKMLVVINCPDAMLCGVYVPRNMPTMLCNFPGITSLVIDSHLLKKPQVINYDDGPASNHLQAPNCLDCTLDGLKIVNIWRLEGSRLELLFIKLLLAGSPSLEKLAITPSGSFDAEKRYNLAKDLMRFPRASPKAEFIYLDLENYPKERFFSFRSP